MALTIGQLIVELKERSRDLSTPVQINGFGDIEDIEFDNEGCIILIGENQDERQ